MLRPLRSIAIFAACCIAVLSQTTQLDNLVHAVGRITPTCAELGCGREDIGICSCATSCTKWDNCCQDYWTHCTSRHHHFELRDVTLVVTTDIHSWVSGHHQVRHINATLAHAVSLVQQIKTISQKERHDVFFFDNGDINDGTGMSATAQDHVSYLVDIMRNVPYDALNIGNHELYQLDGRGEIEGKPCAIVGMRDTGYIDHWNGKYLTSNVVWADTRKPVGSRYAVITGEFGTNLLVFGFLYNMKDHCDAVIVEDVSSCVNSGWFRDAVDHHSTSVDAVVILAHMDYRDELVDVILTEVRRIVGQKKPVQFLTGHSHIRGSRRLDAFASSFEAGCKLNTVGFVQFDTHTSGAQLDFNLVAVDGNTADLAGFANLSQDDLMTPQGKVIARTIDDVSSSLGLDREVGCSDTWYRNWAPLDQNDSLWALYVKRVLPDTLFVHERQWAIIGTDALTYDIFPGWLTVNDAYTTSPYANFWLRVSNVRGSVLEELEARLDNKTNQEDIGERWRARSNPSPDLPSYVTTGRVDTQIFYELIYCDFDAWTVETELRQIVGKVPESEVYRPRTNTSSVLVSWFQDRTCKDNAVVV